MFEKASNDRLGILDLIFNKFTSFIQKCAAFWEKLTYPDIEGMRPDAITRRLLERNIIITKTPYRPSYARLAPSILSSPEEIDRVLREIRTVVPV